MKTAPCSRFALALALSLSAWFAQTASAQFVLVETGGTFRGDATNLAAVGNGTGPFAQSELGLPHTKEKLFDSIYGNSSSWIGNFNSNPGGSSYVGVIFSGAINVGSFAFGRDNTGFYTDRAVGTYLIQYTTTPSLDPGAPNPNAASWVTIGTLDYINAAPLDPSLRHLYNLTTPLTAVTGFRFTVINGIAIDEIEVYATTAIPEPSTYAALLGAAALGLVVWRRKTRPTS